MVFGWFGPNGNVQVNESLAEDPNHDTVFVLTNWEADAESEFAGSSLKGYEPTAFVLALILATPIPLLRRLWAAAFGLVLVSLYAAIRTGVFLVFAFSRDNDLAVFSLGPTARGAIEYVFWVVGESFGGWLLVPLPIWALVCLWAARSKAGSPQK